MSVILQDKLSLKIAKRAERPVKKTAKELRAEKLAAMTPEQRVEFLKAERLRELIRAAQRSGKVDEQDLIDLDVTL